MCGAHGEGGRPCSPPCGGAQQLPSCWDDFTPRSYQPPPPAMSPDLMALGGGQVQ